MGTLRLGAAAFALGWAAPAAADPVERWSAHIAEASARFGVPERWIRRVMKAESGGRAMLRGRPIRSHAGAMGLMQVMPATWREMRAAHGLGSDPDDPRDNILAGAAYLRAMHDRFGYPGFFAAYNAGPARYAQHLATGRRLPAETVAYVKNVAEPIARDPGASSSPQAPAQSIFVVLRVAASREPAPPAAAPSALFVRLGETSRH